jgi:Asp-tRNA(Asn)/Glu-tRNA(Gln) amidotransferase A subunit family amidase
LFASSFAKLINAGHVLTETIVSLSAVYRSDATTPEETVKRFYARLSEYNDPAIFISLRDEAEAIAVARVRQATPACLSFATNGHFRHC